MKWLWALPKKGRWPFHQPFPLPGLFPTCSWSIGSQGECQKALSAGRTPCPHPKSPIITISCENTVGTGPKVTGSRKRDLRQEWPTKGGGQGCLVWGLRSEEQTNTSTKTPEISGTIPCRRGNFTVLLGPKL